MAEIAENLHRREITALERAELIDAWAALRGGQKRTAANVSGQLGQKPIGGRPAGGISEAARDLGMARKTVERAVKVASLSDEAKKAAKTHGLADNQSALLDAAKAKTPAAQVEALRTRAGSKKADLITRRKVLYEARHPETKAGVAGAIAKHSATAKLAVASNRPGREGDPIPEGAVLWDEGVRRRSFAEVTHMATGKSLRDVQRATSRGIRIGGEDLRRVAGTSLDKLDWPARGRGLGVHAGQRGVPCGSAAAGM